MRLRLLLAPLLAASSLLADGTMERYHVAPVQLSKSLLRDTVGVLTLLTCVGSSPSDCALRDESLELYDVPPPSSARAQRRLLLATVPVSSHGYDRDEPTRFVFEWRFPVTAIRRSFIQIVYDVPRDARAWVRLSQVTGPDRGMLVRFDDLLAARRSHRFFIDAGYLFRGLLPQLYRTPSFNHPLPRRDVSHDPVTYSGPGYNLIRQGDSDVSEDPLIPMAVRHGFVQVRSAFAADSGAPSPAPLGWLPIRDRQGLLLIWLINSPTC